MGFSTDQLRHINSMTKYPSIETYHHLDPKNGMLLDNIMDFGGCAVVVTEKVNGTNGRIVLFPDGDWIIGSREELLHARGDRIANPALGIVDAARRIAAHLSATVTPTMPTIYYGEVYGHGIEGGKQYTRTKGATGFRLFDIAVICDFDDMLDWPIEKVASWRQHGGQTFLPEDLLIRRCDEADLELAPRLGQMPARELPTDIDKARVWLGEILPQTHVALDGEPGRAEGVVLRSLDRSVIAKARFEDYHRTIRRRANTR